MASVSALSTVPKAGLSYARGDWSEPVLERTIGDALRAAAAEWGARTALVDGCANTGPRRRWSYTSLLQAAEQAACVLLRHFAPGDHIAICAANSPEWVIAEFGAALAGIVLVTANPTLQSRELRHLLSHSKASGILVQPEHRGRDLLAMIADIRSGLRCLREVISLAEWSGIVWSAQHDSRLPPVSAGDVAQIQYTSGTTGLPKGALLTHRGLSNNARFYARTIRTGPDDVWINPMPLFHTAGCALATLGALQTGGTHVLAEVAEPATLLELMESERGTHLLCVPTMLLRMLDYPDMSSRDLSSWRLCTLGGAPVAPELVRRARERIGVEVAIGYGQTEASPYLTHTLPKDPNPEWISTVGRPLPRTEIRIADPLSGGILPLEFIGEIQARSYGVMRGYFEDTAATAAALDREGWLRTGDLGSMDQHGYVRVQGRLKDMIIRGGENIYPREIEDVLFTHPYVANIAVIGVPDPEWGEAVAAFVQARPGTDPNGPTLEAFCRLHMAPHKVPRHWHFVPRLPQTASGKIQKFLLREEASRTPDTA
ncbi:MAG: AMP-binding protein [Acetobacteraceae bacterium]|nr:AMP-binding protein [Acetobacteraceae bacterium]